MLREPQPKCRSGQSRQVPARLAEALSPPELARPVNDTRLHLRDAGRRTHRHTPSTGRGSRIPAPCADRHETPFRTAYSLYSYDHQSVTRRFSSNRIPHQTGRATLATSIGRSPKNPPQGRSWVSDAAAYGSERLRFVDEHDGNVILHLVRQSAIVAEQARRAFFRSKLTVALGADQDLEQLGVNHFATEVHGNRDAAASADPCASAASP